jgi:uncharacterized protein
MLVFKSVKENAEMQKSSSKEEKVLLFDKVSIAKSFFKKLAGLVFSGPLNLGEGLLIEGCNSIHTFWMRFAIDAVFINKDNIVIHLKENLKPFRLSPIIRGAVSVLELKSGAIKHKGIKKYDTLFFSNHPAI